jgi:hypothetical protein
VLSTPACVRAARPQRVLAGGVCTCRRRAPCGARSRPPAAAEARLLVASILLIHARAERKPLVACVHTPEWSACRLPLQAPRSFMAMPLRPYTLSASNEKKAFGWMSSAQNCAGVSAAAMTQLSRLSWSSGDCADSAKIQGGAIQSCTGSKSRALGLPSRDSNSCLLSPGQDTFKEIGTSLNPKIWRAPAPARARYLATPLRAGGPGWWRRRPVAFSRLETSCTVKSARLLFALPAGTAGPGVPGHG